MLDDDDQAICCFNELGERPIPAELDSGELPAQVKALERFVCCVYNPKGATTLPSLRWELFRSKNLEGANLPRCYLTSSVQTTSQYKLPQPSSNRSKWM